MDADKQAQAPNRLEEAIMAAKEGLGSIDKLVAVLLSEQVFVPSGTEPQERFDELTPVVYKKEKTEMVAVFSSLYRAESIREQAGFLLQVQFAAFIKALKPESGIGAHSTANSHTPSGNPNAP